MPGYSAPMINLYARDLARAVAFYTALGFVETFRTPASGEPAHVELRLDGFTLGIATIEAAREHHGLRPAGDGRWIEIVVWTDDTDAALKFPSLHRNEGCRVSLGNTGLLIVSCSLFRSGFSLGLHCGNRCPTSVRWEGRA
jgi:catechol 2,3-dioxygenase-like lactoylglutathione lyase family enzyme